MPSGKMPPYNPAFADFGSMVKAMQHAKWAVTPSGLPVQSKETCKDLQPYG